MHLLTAAANVGQKDVVELIIFFPESSFAPCLFLVCFGPNHPRDPVLQFPCASVAVAWVVGLWQMSPLGWGRSLG